MANIIAAIKPVFLSGDRSRSIRTGAVNILRMEIALGRFHTPYL
jgi:hypothetical protein